MLLGGMFSGGDAVRRTRRFSHPGAVGRGRIRLSVRDVPAGEAGHACPLGRGRAGLRGRGRVFGRYHARAMANTARVRRQNRMPNRVGNRQARSVHRRLFVSLRMVMIVVEHGQ